MKQQQLFFMAFLFGCCLIQAAQITHAAEKKQENEKLQAVQRAASPLRCSTTTPDTAQKKQKVVMMAPEQELLLPAAFPMELHQLIRDYLFNYREDFFPILYQSIPLVGHAQHIRVVTMTPDCSTIVTGGGGNEKLAKVWDVAGKCIKSLDNHTGFINAVAVTPDGKFVVTGSWVGDARVWDRERDCVAQYGDPQNGHAGDIVGIAITPDGNKIITSSDDKTVKIWDRKTAQCVCTLGGRDQWRPGDGGRPGEIVMSNDGCVFVVRDVALGGGGDAIRVYDISGKIICSLVHDSSVSSFAFNGDMIVTGTDNRTCMVWGKETSRCIKTLTASRGAVAWVSINSDKIAIVNHVLMETICVMRIWDCVSGFYIETCVIPCAIDYFVHENAFMAQDPRDDKIAVVKKFNHAIRKELPQLSYAQLVCLKQLLDSLNESQAPLGHDVDKKIRAIVLSKHQGVALFALPVEYQRNICMHYNITETAQEFNKRMDQDCKKTEK